MVIRLLSIVVARFAPTLADWLLRALRTLIPQFKGSMIKERNRRRSLEGYASCLQRVAHALPQCLASNVFTPGSKSKDVQEADLELLRTPNLKAALEVVKQCFPEAPVGMSRDRRWLEKGGLRADSWSSFVQLD